MAKHVYTLREPPPQVAYRIDYDTLLNAEQREVVFAEGGPMLVLAGAGSGKTRTLTYRVARLIESGVAPARILLLTFTNKAAREMISRVAGLLGEVPQGLLGGTFHHVGHMILRRDAERLDYPSEFTILDSEDAQTLMNIAVGDAEVDTTRRRFPRARLLCRLYSLAQNTDVDPKDIVLRRAPHLAESLDDIARVYDCYERRKRQIGAMDYDDLLVNWHRLFRENKEVWLAYAERFEHVLVDEYQDTNQLQGRLIDDCADIHGNLMVVGDDCQSIYSFRGADYSNILDFPKRHRGTRIFKLETNYRSTPQILALANDCIRYNRDQFPKRLRSVQPEDVLPAVVACPDPELQARFVAQRALEIREEDVPLDEIAVLYRAHHQSMELQVELSKRGIPFVVRSGVRFFEQSHIKDVLSFLKYVFNPRDELAFFRILRTADGIGKRLGARLWSGLSRHESPTEGWHSDAVADSLPKRASRSWDRLRRQLILLRHMSASAERPDKIIDAVVEGGYRSYIRKSFENFDNRLADLTQLGNFAAQHDNLEAFLNEVLLQSSIEGEDVVEGGELDERLVLSTIHQAKGLEFRAVFVIWAADGHFPNARAEDEGNLEEERRLFYVATTRAKNELYLCHPVRARDRERRMTIVRRSPFLDEIASDHYEEWVLRRESAH